MSKTYFEDVFAYFGYGGDSFKYKDVVRKAYRKAARWKIFNELLCVLGRKPKQIAYVFIGAKYRNLMRALGKGSVVAVGGPRQLLAAMKLGVRFHCNARFLAALAKSYEHKDHDLLETTIQECAQLLAQWKTQALVVINDSLPLERLWIAAARQAGVPSICLQHGLFSESGGELNDGKFVDLMCVYDSHQKSVLENTGARNVRVFGYFEDISQRAFSHSSAVCVLGQPWVQYHGDKGPRYTSILKVLLEHLENSGFDWTYKPHPSENDIHSYLGQSFKRKIYKRSLSRALNEFDVFISFSSTALLEVTLAGKVAVQIQDEVLSPDNFFDLGYAYTVESGRLLAELRDVLGKRGPMPCPLDRRTIKERFLYVVRSAFSKRKV